MIEELKRKRMLKNGLWALLLAAAALGLLAASGFGVFKWLAGPKALEELSPDEMKGAYVEAYIPYLYAGYAQTTSTSGSETTVIADEYIIDAGPEYYMGLYVSGSWIDPAEQLYDQSWYYSQGQIDLDTLYDSLLVVRGTVLEMDDETRGYYQEVLADMGVTGAEDLALFLPYVLVVDQVGRDEYTVLYTILAALFLAGALWLVIRAALGVYQADAVRLCRAQGPGEPVMRERLDGFYQTVTPVHGVRADANFVCFEEGAYLRVLAPADVVWAYKTTTHHRTNGIPSGKSHTVTLRTRAGKRHEIRVRSEAAAEELLRYLFPRLPDTAFGYETDYETQWRGARAENYAFFAELAHRQHGAAPEEPPAAPGAAAEPAFYSGSAQPDGQAPYQGEPLE